MGNDVPNISCWCGEEVLFPFSEFYLRCRSCNTLVSVIRNSSEYYKGGDTDTDLYGKDYWTKHVKKLGFPDIYDRSRADLCERSLFWLRSILKYKLPPAKTLELGCAHGGSVYLQRLAGYDAAGAEMSPWLCDFARATFDVPMYCGDIEDIDIPNASLDIVILMDVLEHFPNPLKSLKRIIETLSDDGIIVIQTPAMRPIGKSYDQMREDGEMFLQHLKENEHLYLYNEESIKILFARLGLHHVAFEPPIFAYDMFVFAGKQPFKENTIDVVEKWLIADPSRRSVLALLDLYSMLEVKVGELGKHKQDINKLAVSRPESNGETALEIAHRCYQEVSAELSLIKNSLTWKLSAPLRKYCDKFRRLFF